jgi:hypothetical protein
MRAVITTLVRALDFKVVCEIKALLHTQPELK